MTKAEILREMGVHLKKVVDIYNQLAKNPQAFTPGEIDMLVNNAARIIEYGAALKHQPASVSNSDDLIRIRDMEDKLRVLNEQLKNKDSELVKLQKANEELTAKVEEHKHLAEAFSVNIPEISQEESHTTDLSKKDLLNESFNIDIHPPVTETIVPKTEPEPEVKNISFEKTIPVYTPPKPEQEPVNEVPKTILSTSQTHVHTIADKHINEGVKESLVDKMQQSKVEDLKKAIPLHEKFQYTNELFGKNPDHYNQFLDAMHTKGSWKEAEALLAQAASMYKWDPENKTALQFIALIQRRFN